MHHYSQGETILFGTRSRHHFLLRCLAEKTDRSAFRNEYARHLESDLSQLFSYLNQNSAIGLMVLEKDFVFSAFVGKGNTIFITAGLVLAIDEFSSLLAECISSGGDIAKLKKKIYPKDRFWSERFYDYSNILKYYEENQIQIQEMIYLTNSTSEGFMLRCLISNTILLWVIAHELGHIHLGHVDYHFSKPDADEKINLDDATLQGDASLTDQRQLLEFYAREFHADLFATVSLETIFKLETRHNREQFLNSEGEFPKNNIFTMLRGTIAYAPLLFEKANRMRVANSSSYPYPMARMVNSWVASFVATEVEDLAQTVRPDLADEHYLFNEVESNILWLKIIDHVEKTADFLDLKFIDENEHKKHLDLSKRLRYAALSNDFPKTHQFIDFQKLLLTIQNYKYNLNFFTPHEQFHTFVEQWRSSVQHLADNLEETYSEFRSELNAEDDGLLSIARLTVDYFIDQLQEGREKLEDVSEIKHILNTVLITSGTLHKISRINDDRLFGQLAIDIRFPANNN